MRAILAVILFIASSGMIFAGFTADTPLPGIDYDIEAAVQDSCGAQASQGNKLLSYLSSSGSESEMPADTPNKSTVSLLRYLTCGLLDD